MRDNSLGITFKNFVFRYEILSTPFFKTYDESSSSLKGNFIVIGFRKKIPYHDFRYGATYGRAFNSRLGPDNLKKLSAYKIALFGERWVRFRIRKFKALLSFRIFYEYRYWEFETPRATGLNFLNTSQLGIHIGIAKVF